MRSYNLEPVYDLSKKGTLLINQLDGEKISPDIADFKKTKRFLDYQQKLNGIGLLEVDK